MVLRAIREPKSVLSHHLCEGRSGVLTCPRKTSKLVAIRHDEDRVGVGASLVWICVDPDRVCPVFCSRVGNEAVEFFSNVLFSAVQVTYGNFIRPFVEQCFDDVQGRRLTDISRVLLESKAEQADLFPDQVFVQGANDLFRETVALQIVHGIDLIPVMGHVVQAQSFGQVDETGDVFPETGSSETQSGLEELGTNTHIETDRVGNFIHISACGVANGTDGIDAADPLCEHRVGHQLGEFGGEDIDLDDFGPRDPGSIYGGKSAGGQLSGRRLGGPNDHTVRSEEILDR